MEARMTVSIRLCVTRRTKSVLSALLTLTVIASVAVGARVSRTAARAGVNRPAPKAESAVIAQPQQERQTARLRIESELITITPHGFEPAEITRPRGQFLLTIDNRSGLAASALQLTSEAGPRES
jgi:hypothetical protein